MEADQGSPSQQQLTSLLPEYAAAPLHPILLLHTLRLSSPITPAQLWLQDALGCALTPPQGDEGHSPHTPKFMSI